MKSPRYITSWSNKWKRGAKRHGCTEPLTTFGEAMKVAQEKRPHAKTVVILREGEGINHGTFFLDFIVK